LPALYIDRYRDSAWGGHLYFLTAIQLLFTQSPQEAKP